MPNSEELDVVFGALAHATRREVLESLRAGPKTVGELAARHDMALPSFLQHIRLLEQCGLVTTEKRGRARVVSSRHEPMLQLEAWLDDERRAWQQRLDQLDDFLIQGNAK